MKRRTGFLAAFGLVLLVIISGCAGGGSTPAGQSAVAATSQTASGAAVSGATLVVSPAMVRLGASQSRQFTATVTGSSDTSVTWKIACSPGDDCGSISSTGLYAAPAAVTKQTILWIQATPATTVRQASAGLVYLMPIDVELAPSGPAPTIVLPGGTSQFTATVLYDPHNAGVTWSLPAGCSATTCGMLSNIAGSSVTYTAPPASPDPPLTTLTAASLTDGARTATVTISFSPRALAEGDYAFSYNGWRLKISGGYYFMYRVAAAGHFHADAQGNISDGMEDINLDSGVAQSVPFTGTYAVGADGRGVLNFTSAQGTSTYFTTINSSGTKGDFLEMPATEESPYGAGYFELQDKSAFSLPVLSGDYAMGVFGTWQEWTRIGAVGRFTANPAGTLAGGVADMAIGTYVGSQPQTNYPKLALSGSFTAPSSSTGRGTATLTFAPTPNTTAGTFNFAYYVVSDQKLVLVQTDPRASNMPVLSGEVRRQAGPFSVVSFNAPSIFSMTGSNNAIYGGTSETAAAGRIVPDGTGWLTGTIDANDVWPNLVNVDLSGSYSVDPDRRSSITLQTQPARNEIAYFYGPNEAFVMDASGTDVLFGTIKSQTGAPFSAASLSGAFLTNTAAPNSELSSNQCGFTIFDGAGAFTIAMDGDDGLGKFVHAGGTGTYTVSANGRGTLTSSYGTQEFWVISPTELVGLNLTEYKK